MKVKKYKSDKEVLIKVSKYKIIWDKAPSKGQLKLQQFLYPFWKNCIVLKEMFIPGTKWRFDIVNCNKKIIVEYSPLSHHNNYNKFFHKSRIGYIRSLKSDLDKFEWAVDNGFKVLEINEDDLEHLSYEFVLNKFNISLI